MRLSFLGTLSVSAILILTSPHTIFAANKALDQFTSDDLSRFPRPLSPMASLVYQKAMESALTFPTKTPTPPHLIGASGRLISHLVEFGNSKEFARRVITPVILQAQEEVLLTTFIYSKDSPTAVEIREALIELDRKQKIVNAGRSVSQRRRIRVWLAIDSFGAAFYDHKPFPPNALTQSKSKIDPAFYNLPRPEDVPALDLRVRAIHHGLLGALHTKMIVVDGRLAVVGSKNIDGDTCMEYTMALEGSIAWSLRADFQRIWAGDRAYRKAQMQVLKQRGVKDMDQSILDVIFEDEDQVGDLLDDELGDRALPQLEAVRPITGPRPGDVPMLLVGRVQGNHLYSHQEVNPQDVAWITAMDNAKHEIYIQTPNFVAKSAADAVERAVRRGVTVIVVTAWSQQDFREAIQPNSVGSNRGTAVDLFKRLNDDPVAGKRLKFCWFISDKTPDSATKHATREDWSHIKAMFIDRAMGIIGSGYVFFPKHPPSNAL